ncbi:gamma-gliadin B-like isoform X2 [Bradysia coprophila]|uniref:gamma-gliadin B-like isoform X2 n=1 Tax=Bradysia coprophila TaxID=38358 RepID=UPI00187DB067|nr:gamma-gliadin B-like isoform X2 [Bradysia coprophila]
MFRILKLVLLAAATNCAPATFLPFAAPFAQPYFFIGPQPQSHFQYQPLLKIQQPAVPAAKIDSPKNQYIFLYPNAPQFPLVALRQEEDPSGEQPAEPAPGNTEGKMEMAMAEKNMGNMQSLLPASTMSLNMNKQRFYLINSLPQFYAPLPAATIANPILTIQPLKARSAIDSIPAENEQVEQIRAQDVESVQQPAVVQPIPQIQLRSNIVEPLQRLEINQPQVPVVDNEPVPEMASEQIARFLEEAAPNTVKINENESNQLRAGEPLEDMTSTALANPSGIAISGKGGLSSSSPVATAVTGESGTAQASPTAISLSGNFENEEMKLKQTEPFAPL